MDVTEAAQNIFASLARCLQKYLRITRQQPRHTADQVIRHLAQCLTYDVSPKAFLERFFAGRETHDVRMSSIILHFCCENNFSDRRVNSRPNGRSCVAARWVAT